MIVCSALLSLLVQFPLVMSISNIIVSYGLGDGVTVAVVLAFYTAGAIVIGLLFKFIVGIFKDKSAPFFMIFEILGIICLVFGKSIPFYCACFLLCGIASFGLMPLFPIKFNELLKEKSVSAISVANACNTLVGFVASYYLLFIQGFNKTGALEFPLYIAIVVGVLLTVAFYFLFRDKKQSV